MNIKSINTGSRSLRLALTALMAVVVVSFLPVAAEAADLPLAYKVYQEGIRLYAYQDYEGASHYLAQMVHMVPEHDQARYYLAYSYAMSNQLSQAIHQAEILIERNPGHSTYATLLAQLHQLSVKNQAALTMPTVEESQHTGAYDVYTPSPSPPRESRPRRTSEAKQETPLHKAIALIDEEQYDGAESALQTILRAEPNNASVMHYMGVLFMNQGNFAKASEHFEKSLALRANSYETNFFAGMSYLNQQLLKKAEEKLTKAISIKSDPFAHMGLADIYYRTERLTQAEEMYQKVASKHPDYSDAMVGLAQVKLAQGRSEDSMEIINQVLAKNPQNARARHARAAIFMENRLYTDALDEAQAAFQASGGNPEFRSHYALALLRNFRIQEGMDEAQAVLDTWPDFIEARLILAEGLIMSENREMAAHHLEIIEDGRELPQAEYLRALLAAGGGDNIKARQHYDNYVKAVPDRPAAHMRRAAFLETIADYTAAKEAYETVVKKFPEATVVTKARDGLTRVADKETDSSASSMPPRPPIPGL